MKLVNLLSILLLSFFLLTASTAQVDSSLKVFEPVPANQRASLAERLKLFIELHGNKQYDRLFDMFPKINTQHPEITKDQFLAEIKKYGKTHIIDFVPEYTTVNPTIDGEFAIFGCAKVREGWSKKKWLATTYASLEHGKWVFSDIGFMYQLEARNPAPCSKKNR